MESAGSQEGLTVRRRVSVREAAELLSRLVACPSVNPTRSSPLSASAGETGMARLLADLLTSWGGRTSVQEVAPGRPNLIAQFKGRSVTRLVFEAHSDTVGVKGMTIAPFSPLIRDGRLYGRGACDAKGPMAAMLLAIRAILDEEQELPLELCFVSTCDEELGAAGARRLMLDGFTADAAVVAEPTELRVVYAHKGAVRLKIRTTGVAVHSSRAEHGVNAISQMRRVLEVIDGPLRRLMATKRHEALGTATITVGTIHGGTHVNVVPPTCEIEVDRRTLPNETPRGAIAEVVRALEELKRDDARFQYDLTELNSYPALDGSPEALIARVVEHACCAVLGRAEFSAEPWTANSGFFQRAGIPCVVFGPGSIAQAHTVDEWIDLESVVKAAQIYVEIIREFADDQDATA